ncbi:MAG: hypothetical protein P4L99_13870 [Chthoniobacter sp.]|nr:hypothetical protein [Chthoniobacter sp.]
MHKRLYNGCLGNSGRVELLWKSHPVASIHAERNQSGTTGQPTAIVVSRV